LASIKALGSSFLPREEPNWLIKNNRLIAIDQSRLSIMGKLAKRGSPIPLKD
jgi:hypothetical protein